MMPHRPHRPHRLRCDTAALAATIEPDDVADAAWWLGAGAAKTTGEVLPVDAGFRITKA